MLTPQLMAGVEQLYILECTSDGSGWVAAVADGSMMITWEHMRFLKTIHVIFSEIPVDEREKQVHLKKIEELVEWLSDHHFEKMHKPLS